MAYPALLLTPNEFEPKIDEKPATQEQLDQKKARQLAKIPLLGDRNGEPIVLTPSKATLDKPPGVSRLVVLVGDKASASFNNGGTTDGDKRAEAEKALKNAPFCVAPGDDAIDVGWKVTNPASIASVKFELFARTQKAAVGTGEWSGDDLVARLTGGLKSQNLSGSISLNDGLVKLDPALFPDGVPTAEHSPYQLRMTVTAKPGTSEARPTTAWTHFHVAVHSIALEWGEEAWLDDQRPDVADAQRPALLAAEKKVLADLARQRVDDPLLMVTMPGNVVNGSGADNVFGVDWQKAYGDGVRIPLRARVLLRKADGGPSAKAAKKALGKAQLLWDWEDGRPKKLDDWLTTEPRPSLLSQTRFKEFVDKDAGVGGTDFPVGSNNAPVVFGGKRGKGGKPVFPPMPGGAAFPFEVVAADKASKRPWAALSRCGTGDLAGQAGVIFQPARTLGDTYFVNVYMVSGGEDLTQVADTDTDRIRTKFEKDRASAPPFATSGCFETQRQVTLNLYAYPAYDKALFEAAFDYFGDVTGTAFELKLTRNLPAVFTDVARIDASIEQKQGASKNGFLRDHIIIRPSTGAGPDGAIPARNHAEYRAYVEQQLRSGVVQALELDRDITTFSSGVPVKTARIFPRLKNAANVSGWLLGAVPDVAGAYFVLLADKTRPFALNDALKPDHDTGNPVTVKRVVSQASAWGADVVARLEVVTDRKAREDKVEVTLGTRVIPLTFPTKGLRGKVSRSVSKADRATLQTELVNAARASDGRAPLTATVKGVARNERGQQRLQNVVAALRQLVRDAVVVDTAHVWDLLNLEPETALGHPGRFPLAAYPFQLTGEFATQAFTDGLAGDGIHYFAYSQFSKATHIASGAVYPMTAGTSTAKAIGFHSLPVASPSVKQLTLAAKTLLVHELAHAMHLGGHAMRQLFDTKEQEASSAALLHVDRDTCVMNYDVDPTSAAFCATCQARLRGWLVTLADKKTEEQVAVDTLKAEIAKGGDDVAWKWMRLAYLLSTTQAVKDAETKYGRAVDNASNKALADYRATDEAKKEKASITKLEDKGDKATASDKKRLAQLKANRSANEEAWKARAVTAAAIANAPEMRSAFGPIVEAARKAWKLLTASGVTPQSPPGVTMLRNLTIVEAKYGEPARAIDLWNELRAITTATLDLETSGPAEFIERLLGSTTADEYRFTLELGDTADLFTEPAKSDKGKMQRLQVLGLFPVPLDHPRADEALDVAWRHATRLIPGLDGDPGLLDAEVKAFLVSGGSLTANPFAKLRLAANQPVLYAQQMLMYMFPEREFPKSRGFQKGLSPEETPFSRYMIGSEEKDPEADPNDPNAPALSRSRFQIEDEYEAANPAYGKIPVKVKVERRPAGSTNEGDWAPSAAPLVCVELVAPDDLPPYDATNDKVRHNVGQVGVSFFRGVSPPPVVGAAANYLQATLDAYEVADDDDPQWGNAHANVGGKRGLSAEGKLGVATKDPRKGGVVRANLFTDVASKGYANFADTEKAPFEPNSVHVRGDTKGIVRFLFAPSRIGGDRYKLRISMAPVAGREAPAGEVVTSTLVRWRTIRISRHVRLEPHTGPDDLTPSLRAYHARPDAPPVLKNPPALPQIDFTNYPATEFAKAHCELIFDPQALAPVAPFQFRQAFVDEIEALLKAHPVANRTEPGRAGGGRSVSPFRVPFTKAEGSATLYKADVGCKLEWGSFSVRPVGAGPKQALFDDSALAAEKAPPAKYDMAPKNGAQVRSAWVKHAEGLVEVDFTVAPTQQLELVFDVDDYLDVVKFLEFPEKSPFLFNLKSPERYNESIGDARRKKLGAAPDGVEWSVEPDASAKSVIGGQNNGLVKGLLMTAFARAIDGNKGLSPGLNIIHASVLDPYEKFLKLGTQEGKGVGQAIYLFGGDERIALHELAHGIYFQHAGTAPAANPAAHVAGSPCVMEYGNERSFCGKCVASLRGMRIDDEPFDT